jgi:DNA (cytosine-5)-methyltransferase 1
MKQPIYKNHSRKVYDLTQDQRDRYREISLASRIAKLEATKGLHKKVHEINTPVLAPETLMPQLGRSNLTALSLFSGGGGLDLGFDKAGFKHISSYELIPICEKTLRHNRPEWQVYCGLENGDVTKVNWEKYKGKIDIIHGGPPCQPFSIAGEQKGINDERNMWGEFQRAINTIKPKAFVAENVLGLLNPKFADFVKRYIVDELCNYHIVKFKMHAADFGIPQVRQRVFFVGFRNKKDFKKFIKPAPTHSWKHLCGSTQLSLFDCDLPKTLGVRASLGLTDIGFDNLAPTIRSAFTGKRNTTSVLNSAAGQKSWGDMQIWPNGVQADRAKASAFPAKNDHFRLSVQDVALIQGFPESWQFKGAVYQALGQIGNSVAPPVAYQVAKNVLTSLL